MCDDHWTVPRIGIVTFRLRTTRTPPVINIPSITSSSKWEGQWPHLSIGRHKTTKYGTARSQTSCTPPGLHPWSIYYLLRAVQYGKVYNYRDVKTHIGLTARRLTSRADHHNYPDYIYIHTDSSMRVCACDTSRAVDESYWDDAEPRDAEQTSTTEPSDSAPCGDKCFHRAAYLVRLYHPFIGHLIGWTVTH